MKKHIFYKKDVNRIVFGFCFAICFVFSSRNALHAVPITDNWDAYQTEILKEHSNFSGWCPKEKAARIMNLIQASEAKICVEVGVFGGSSFFPLTAALAFKKQGMAYAIDPWTNDSCIEGYEDANTNHVNYWGKVDLEKVMNKFIQDMHRNGLDEMFQVMRMTSAESCGHFKDESIDFLHIDGNHSEQAALFDVEHWLPKVKQGGIICFDDAWWESTQPAIKMMLKTCDIMKESSSKWQYIFLKKK